MSRFPESGPEPEPFDPASILSSAGGRVAGTSVPPGPSVDSLTEEANRRLRNVRLMAVTASAAVILVFGGIGLSAIGGGEPVEVATVGPANDSPSIGDAPAAPDDNVTESGVEVVTVEGFDDADDEESAEGAVGSVPETTTSTPDSVEDPVAPEEPPATETTVAPVIEHSCVIGPWGDLQFGRQLVGFDAVLDGIDVDRSGFGVFMYSSGAGSESLEAVKVAGTDAAGLAAEAEADADRIHEVDGRTLWIAEHSWVAVSELIAPDVFVEVRSSGDVGQLVDLFVSDSLPGLPIEEGAGQFPPPGSGRSSCTNEDLSPLMEILERTFGIQFVVRS